MELHSIETIVKALNDAGVRYLVVGGLAVNAHGFSRLTRDVDLVIDLEKTNITRGLNTLIAIGYQLAIPVRVEEFAEAQNRELWRGEKGMIVLKLWSDKHRRTPIDVFVYEPFDFRAELARAPHFEVAPGVSVPVVSLPTLLAMKREAGRPQDMTDIVELTRIS